MAVDVLELMENDVVVFEEGDYYYFCGWSLPCFKKCPILHTAYRILYRKFPTGEILLCFFQYFSDPTTLF